MPDVYQTHSPQAVEYRGEQWFHSVDCQRYATAFDNLTGMEGQPRDIQPVSRDAGHHHPQGAGNSCLGGVGRGSGGGCVWPDRPGRSTPALFSAWGRIELGVE